MWSNKYLDIPYLLNGRTDSGADCWGLVRLIYKNEFNIDLPSFQEQYTNTSSNSELAEVSAVIKEGWQEVDIPHEGTVTLFRVLGEPIHVGVALDSQTFIHTRKKAGVAIEKFSNPKWKSRVLGHFKYVQQAKLTAIPHPLKNTRIESTLPLGSTLQDVYDNIVKDIGELGTTKFSTVSILVNSVPVPKAMWNKTVVQPNDIIDYRAVPGVDDDSGVFRLVLMAALTYFTAGLALPTSAAAAGMGAAQAGLVGAFGVSTATGLAMLKFGVVLIGSALIDVIAPIPKPPTMDTAQSESMSILSGSQNTSNPRGTIPFVLGTVRATPPIGAQSYEDFNSDQAIEDGISSGRSSYLRMLLVWGFGPLSIDQNSLRVGTTAFTSFNGSRQVTLEGYTSDISTTFDEVYSRDVSQVVAGTGGLNTLLYFDPASWDSNQQIYTAGAKPPAKSSLIYNPAYNPDYPNDQPEFTTYTPWTPEPEPPSLEVDYAPWREFTITQASTQISVAINFPQGLFYLDKKTGSRGPAPVKIRIQYKYETGSWADFGTGIYTIRGTPDAFNVFTDGSPNKDAFVWRVIQSGFSPTQGNITIRVRRESGHLDDINNKQFVHSASVFSITGYAPSDVKAVYDPPNCKLAKTAVVMLATDSVTGNLEGINALVTSVAKDWNGTSWVNNVATNNPASLFRLVLQHPANAYPVQDSEIDLEALQHWHEFCEAKGYTYNNVLGSQKSVTDVIREICAAGRASPAYLDNKWTVLVDEPKSTIVQHFTPHNSWGFSSTKVIPKLPHALRITFYDESNDYEQTDVIVPYQGYTEETASIFESISLPGVTNKAQIVDLARWQMAQAKLRPERYSLNVDMEHLICSRGDLVRVTHHVPMWGLTSGYIKEKINSKTLKLTENIPATENTGYTIRIRPMDNSTSLEYVVKTQFIIDGLVVSGSYLDITTQDEELPFNVGDYIKVKIITATNIYEDTLQVTQVLLTNSIRVSTSTYTSTQLYTYFTNSTYSLLLLTNYDYSKVVVDTQDATIPVNGEELFLFGTINAESQELIVLSITPTENLQAQISLMDYGGSALFDNYTDLTGIEYSPNITVKPINLIPSLGDKVPTIVENEIISDESVIELLSNNTYSFGLKIPFEHADNLPTNVNSVEAQIDESSDASSTDYSAVRTVYVDYTANSVTFREVEEGKVYRVRLRYIGKDGRTGPYTSWVVAPAIVGRTTPPDSVSEIIASINSASGDIQISWSSVASIDIDGYEVRTSDTNWGQEVSLNEVSNLVYKGKSTSTVISSSALGDTISTLFVKAYDSLGLYSEVATEIASSILIDAPNIASNPIHTFSDTSLTSAEIELSWIAPTKPTNGLDIKGYTVTYSGLSKPYFTANTHIKLPADWVGTREYIITTIDILGQESQSSLSYAVVKSAPNAIDPNAISVQVIDNNVLLYWALPNRSSLPISHTFIDKYLVPDGETVLPLTSLPAGSEEIGAKAGTFTSFSEQKPGTYIYYLRAVDTEDIKSESVAAIVAEVGQPPDYVFNSEIVSNFVDVPDVVILSNAFVNEQPHLYMPVVAIESWSDHFINNGKTTLRQFDTAGYPVYLQPANLSGYVELIFDYGQSISNTQATIEYTKVTIGGTVTVGTETSWSLDGVSWSDVDSSKFIPLFNPFRYLKVKLYCTGVDDKSVIEITNGLTVRLDSKIRREASTNDFVPNALGTGTVVNIVSDKPFSDISSLTITPRNVSSIPYLVTYGLYDSVTTMAYSITGSTVTLTATGLSVDPTESIRVGSRVKLSFTNNAVYSGAYILTGATAVQSGGLWNFTITATITDTVTTTSGQAYMYPNSFVVYVYDGTDGSPITSGPNIPVSWSVQGF